MFQYQIFPFLVAASFQTGFEDLPVEMVANIFRYLDGQSLLNVVRSSRKLASVCRGDPILRRRVRQQLRAEIQFKRQLLLDPRLSVTVTRQGESRMFQVNVAKTVANNYHQLRFSHRQDSERRELQARPFKMEAIDKRGLKSKRVRPARSAPYKVVRV